MKFSELKKCPFCGHDEFYIKIYVQGISCYNVRFDGYETHNEEIYDGLSYKETGRAYCRYCNKYLGNTVTDKIGKGAEKALKERK